jgi:nucleoside-diphosphate-sugar epimerase
MKRLLITGGFGFIGTHLVEELLTAEPDAEIHVVDDLSTSNVKPKEFLDELGNPKNVTYDISTIDDYLYLTDTRFDTIYHLASHVGPAGVLPHAGSMAKDIVEDAYSLALAAMAYQSRMVFVSTSEIYGGGQSSEDDPKIITADVSPRLEYAIGKLAAEISLINLSKKGLDVVIARPFNVAGPRQSGNGGFVLPRFCEAALKDEPLTVFGDGSQIRAFTHVKDMAHGLRLVMEKGETGEAYNIGTEFNMTTIKTLAETVIGMAGSKSEINLLNGKEIYGEHYVEAHDKTPISTKAQTKLGWKPRYSIAEIVKDTLRYTRNKK